MDATPTQAQQDAFSDGHAALPHSGKLAPAAPRLRRQCVSWEIAVSPPFQTSRYLRSDSTVSIFFLFLALLFPRFHHSLPPSPPSPPPLCVISRWMHAWDSHVFVHVCDAWCTRARTWRHGSIQMYLIYACVGVCVCLCTYLEGGKTSN